MTQIEFLLATNGWFDGHNMVEDYLIIAWENEGKFGFYPFVHYPMASYVVPTDFLE